MFDSLDHLSNIPLFKSIPGDELKSINDALQDVKFNKGDVIISEGEVGDSFYLIKSGRVKVVGELKDEGEEIVLSYLTKGDYFGEMSLITGEPRSATVIAETDLQLWQLDKKDFDALMLNNPAITVSLTHMLSQRLRMANKARETSERYYKHKISPRGSLQEVELVKLLKYAEENSLTGKISIIREKQQAIFHYKKGQLEEIDFEEKDENEAMDELLQWESGEFVIEPSVFKISEQEQEPPEDILKKNVACKIFEQYLKEKLVGFVRISGARSTQSAINKSLHVFKEYFDVADDFHIKTVPSVEVKIMARPEWSEKHTLFLAILLRDVVSTLGRDLVGMDFWQVYSEEEQINELLKEHNFSMYFEQAADFAQI